MGASWRSVMTVNHPSEVTYRMGTLPFTHLGKAQLPSAQPELSLPTSRPLGRLEPPRAASHRGARAQPFEQDVEQSR